MLDEELKDYRRQLELAINEALTDSLVVSDVIRQIRARGYDVFLIIEATIGLSRSRGTEPEGEGEEVTTTRLNLTTQDERFLRSLKIRPD